MKAKNLVLITGFIFLINLNGFTQTNNKFEEVKIKTSAQCEMCKERIEEILAFEKGVKSSDLNLESKVVTVLYNPARTTADKIRNAISHGGYDADGIKADPKAYEKLPTCCKKPDDPEHSGH
ncbi:MAG: MerP protein [Bacteroides sp. SM23_62_1]|nr:MAG: MerP protein [Bacteroides sp. SM23_62_1]